MNILTPINLDIEIGNGEDIANLNNETLIGTDGTNKLHILDCENDLSVIKSIQIIDEGENPMDGLQDLVVVGEYVYANRKNDNRILKINPGTGKVAKYYNMDNLINYELKLKSISVKDVRNGMILNGITYDQKRNIFIITGKNFANYYEVELKWKII